MASVLYVRNQATGSGNGSSWANAYTALSGTGGALAAAVSAGATMIWVSDDHVEQGISAAVTLTGGASPAAAVPILCVNHTTGIIASTAVFQCTSGSITFVGYAYCYGVQFLAGANSSTSVSIFVGSTAAAMGWTFEFCLLNLYNTAASTISLGSTNSYDFGVTLINTQLQFGAAGQTVTLNNGTFIWKNTSGEPGVLGTSPVVLFTPKSTHRLLVDGVDLSGIGSGKSIVLYTGLTSPVKMDFTYCLLAAGALPIGSGQVFPAGTEIRFNRVAPVSAAPSGEGGSVIGRAVDMLFTAFGSAVDEMAITLQGGASDNGTALRSKLLKTVLGGGATIAPAAFYQPLESNPITVFNAFVSTAMAVSGIAVSGTTASATVSSTAGLVVGQWVSIGGSSVSGTGFAGFFQIAAIPSSTTFTYTVASGLTAPSGSSITATPAMTVSLQGLWNQAAVPNLDDIWIEVEYYADPSDPKSAFVTSTKANVLVASTALPAPASGVTWNNAPSTSSTFTMTTPPFLVGQSGLMTVRTKVANTLSGALFYVDPKPILSNGAAQITPVPNRTYSDTTGVIINETQSTVVQTVTTTVTQLLPVVRRLRR